MWVWEHALFDYNPKRPGSTKKDKTVEVITKADHDAALRAAKVEGLREAAGRICMFCANLDGEWTDSIKTDFVRHVHPVSRRIEECKAWAIRARIAELEREDTK